MRILILLILYIAAFCTAAFAQEGPGGAANDNNNRFWYASSTPQENDGDKLNNWDNQGGNNNDAYQNSNNSKPTFLNNVTDNMNGYPVIRFDGTNDHLRINNTTDLNVGNGPWTERTFFIVFRTSNDINSRQVIYEEGGTVRGFNMYIYNNNLYYGAWNLPSEGQGSSWGFNQVNTPINTNTEYVLWFRYSGESDNTGTIDCGLNGSSIGSMSGVGWIYNHSGAISIGSKRNDTYYENGASNGNGQYFEGDVAEFIMLNEHITSSQCHLISNYLSAKYDIAQVINDDYTHDNPSNGDYDHDLAGIYRVSGSNEVTDAQGSGNVRVNNAQDLNDSEFFIWAHDGELYEGGELFDVPATVQTRLVRVWKVQEQGDVGSIDISFDLSGLGNVNASDLRLIIDTDSDDAFDDESLLTNGIVDGATDEGNDIYKFSGVTALDNDMRFSLGSVNLMFTPLPIELQSFYGEAAQHSINLYWTTKSEVDNDFFSVQKQSEDGNWKELVKISGFGNSLETKDYEYLDRAPQPGLNVYRLVQHDFNGKTEIHPSISVAFELEDQFTVYPNPPRDYLMVTIKEEGKVQIRMYDSNGVEISLPEEYYYGYVKLDIAMLESGLYILQIEQNGIKDQKKIIVP